MLGMLMQWPFHSMMTTIASQEGCQVMTCVFTWLRPAHTSTLLN